MKTKTIGILGGMGAEATADLYMKIIKYYQSNFGAKYDDDFPAFVIFSVPIPDVVESVQNETRTLEMLIEAAQKVERDGSDFIVIACNTVQFLLEKIRQQVQIPILGIAEVNAKYAFDKGFQKVGILSTEATIKKGVYENDFAANRIELIKPTELEQKIVTQVIMNQLGGIATQEDTNALVQVAEELKKRGAEAVMLACTDLPLVIAQSDTEIPIIDCSANYALAAAKMSAS